MSIYFLLAGDAQIKIKVATGETFVTRERQFDDDERWLGIRPSKKFIEGSEYPMGGRLVVINVAQIVWVEEWA